MVRSSRLIFFFWGVRSRLNFRSMLTHFQL